MGKIQKYRKIVGKHIIEEIKEQAEKLKGKRILHVNSTKNGGGVAELLHTLTPLFNELGIKTQWKVIRGTRVFYKITKGFHNGLQGENRKLSEKNRKIYLNTCKRFSESIPTSHDCVVIHDPQPCAAINFSRKKQPWIWRCHVDLTNPDMDIWNFLKHYISLYDSMIISSNDYIRNDIKTPQSIIMPSIDPLSEKNLYMTEGTAKSILKKYGIDLDKPIISQVSRFDQWKDPMGVISVYNIVKETIDCKLVLLGSTASDDPESSTIYKQVVKQTEHDDDIIAINKKDDRLVNALQRISYVVLQKSIKEGFGLTVAEALWKGTPVIGGAVGGIKSQIQNGNNGYLVGPYDHEACANKVIKLLQDGKLRERMGKYGHDYVKKNFLTTRHLLDWLNVMNTLVK